MYLCPAFNTEADPTSSNVIAMRHHVLVRGALEVTGEVVPMESSYVHTECALKLGPDWRPQTD
jgi:hypothetical protein